MISGLIGIPTLAASLEETLLNYAYPTPVFEGAPVTNLDVMAILAAVLVVVAFWWVGTRVRVTGEGTSTEAYMTHGRVAQLFEVLLVFIREEVVRPNLGKLTDRYIYYIWTVFFFILFANLLGLVPIGETVRFFSVLLTGSPYTFGTWGGTATSTLSLNAPLALVSLVAIVGIGIKENGRHFFAHFAPVPFKPWPMIPVALLITGLEVMGLLIRSVVLAMRLFGTMLAGSLVILAIVYMIREAAVAGGNVLGFAVVPVVLVGGLAVMLLELFIMVLQAFIFTFLTTLFIASGAVHHDEEEHAAEMEEAAEEIEEAGLTAAVEKA